MLRYALLSAGLHVAIILMAIIGLLNYNTDVIDMPQSLPVELVESIEDISKSPDPRPESPHKEEPKENSKKETLPSQSEPAPEPEPIIEPALEDIAPLPALETKEEIKPLAPIIQPPKAKPTFKKPLKKEPKKKKKVQKKPRDFESILKNLTPDDAKKKSGKGGALSDHLAASELDRVRKQIEGAWRLPAGVKGMHELAIKVTLYMNPDRTVREAKLVNKSLLNNPTYGILAETALRAVNEFRYKPLLLPPNKYKVWKEITMEFDPRNLL